MKMLDADSEEEAFARTSLERLLLDDKIMSVSTKYDGTCVGQFSDGTLTGRNHMLQGTSYQHTCLTVVSSCDVAGFRRALSDLLAVDLGRVVVYGELMCNPGYYDYEEKQLSGKWLCYGALLETVADGDQSLVSQELCQLSLALSAVEIMHSVGGGIRLLMCPVLRRMLEAVGCDVVEDVGTARTHVGMVAELAETLSAGAVEGVVLVIPRSGGMASSRKWKNSAEGQGASTKTVGALRSCQSRCANLAKAGSLDERIVDMLGLMVQVAEADTQPVKISRSKTRSS